MEEKNVDEGVPPQAPQSPMYEGAITNMEIRMTLQSFTQAMMALAEFMTTQAQVITPQGTKDSGICVNHNANTITSKLRDFRRMSPHMFFSSRNW